MIPDIKHNGIDFTNMVDTRRNDYNRQVREIESQTVQAQMKGEEDKTEAHEKYIEIRLDLIERQIERIWEALEEITDHMARAKE